MPASCSEHRTHGAKPYVHACACPAPPSSTSTVNYMFEMLDAAGVISNKSAQSAALLRPDPVGKEGVVGSGQTRPPSIRATSPAEGKSAQVLKPDLLGLSPDATPDWEGTLSKLLDHSWLQVPHV